MEHNSRSVYPCPVQYPVQYVQREKDIVEAVTCSQISSILSTFRIVLFPLRNFHLPIFTSQFSPRNLSIVAPCVRSSEWPDRSLNITSRVPVNTLVACLASREIFGEAEKLSQPPRTSSHLSHNSHSTDCLSVWYRP